MWDYNCIRNNTPPPPPPRAREVTVHEMLTESTPMFSRVTRLKLKMVGWNVEWLPRSKYYVDLVQVTEDEDMDADLNALQQAALSH